MLCSIWNGWGDVDTQTRSVGVGTAASAWLMRGDLEWSKPCMLAQQRQVLLLHDWCRATTAGIAQHSVCAGMLGFRVV